MTKLKVCGITRSADAIACADLGVDLLGFNFYDRSPRSIQVQNCIDIQNALIRSNYKITTIGVFVNKPKDELEFIIRECGLSAAQLHGDETADFANSLEVSSYKAFRGIPEIGIIKTYPKCETPSLPQFLMDANVLGEYGGTGKSLDWDLLTQPDHEYPIVNPQRFLLAGGINPENCEEAIKKVHPWGIDVASGVESSPGVKDLDKVRSILQTIKLIDSSQQHIKGTN